MVRILALVIPLTVLAAACAAPGGTARPSAVSSPAVVTSAPSTPAPSAAGPTIAPATPHGPTVGPTTVASPQPSIIPAAVVCGPVESMPLKNPGRLTLSTDIPAYPPWWGGDAAEQYPNEPEGGSEWSTADFSAEPYSMEGFEGATAYAIAAAMGFTPDQIDWIPNAVFENAFTPGEKPFDFHMAQVSINEERAQAVDFSSPYFNSNQSLIAIADNAITGATTIDELKGYTLGAGRNTTSFDLIETIIAPTVEPRVLRSNADALRALQNGQIDGLVVDLGSAFYMRDVQLEDAIIVGQFSADLQADQVGAVLQKDSPLTACVSAAVAEITANGVLDAIYTEWIVSGQDIPFFE